MIKQVLAVLATFFVASSAHTAKQPYSFPQDAVVRVDCGNATGTAFRIGPELYVTASHVTDSGQCFVDGVEVTDKRVIGNDVTSFKGPKGVGTVKTSCRPFVAGNHYLGVGHAFGFPHKTYEPLIASAFKQDGYQTFVGEVIPGMSGGPVIDAEGVAHGVVNKRFPARSIGLADTDICKRK